MIRLARLSRWLVGCDASADFTHGYDEAPADVKAVVFEHALSAAEMPAGKVRSIGTTVSSTRSPNWG